MSFSPSLPKVAYLGDIPPERRPLVVDPETGAQWTGWVFYDEQDQPHIVKPERRPGSPSTLSVTTVRTPGPPSTMSDFSLHSSLEGGFFREDNGRKFQAHNDDYVLPADQQELDRLDHQHYGFKARQGGVNYLAPVKTVLGVDGKGKRILDVGTAVYGELRRRAIEMAQEFPGAEVVGLDLAPVQKEDVPENCRFEIDDASRGLPFPDGTFDVVHARLLTIRHWRELINEMVRVLQPGGLAVFVEMNGMIRLEGDVSLERQREIAPGYTKFGEYLDMAIVKRGLDNVAGETTIPLALKNHPDMKDFGQIYAAVPMWPWSVDPQLKKAGQHMLDDSAEIPHTCRLFIVDACDITMSQYDEVTKGWFDDIGREGVHSILPIWHNWAFKRASSKEVKVKE